MSRLDTCLLRILTPHGQPVGAGFLVAPNLAVTCLHVVSALRQAETDAVQVDFPLLTGREKFSARVVFTDPDRDIAGLELTGDLPRESRPTRLVQADDLWGHRYRAFGFPAGHDSGVYSSGALRGNNADGLLQFDADPAAAYAVQPGFSGGPVWDENLGGVVGMVVVSEADPGARAAFCLSAEALTTAWPQVRPQAIPPNPYRGLAAFREEDAGLFFGRETVVAELLERVNRKPFNTLVGASGSGKSSLIHAGLIPQVRRDAAWLVAAFRPGNQPFEALAAALLAHLEPQLSEVDRLVETRKLAAALASGDLPLVDVVGRILAKTAGKQRLLLVADQFEELFTLCPHADLRRRALEMLLSLTQIPAPNPVSLFLALRADFLAQALAHRPLADRLQEATYMLGPMNREELRQAMVRPAEQQYVTFEVGLDNLILDQVEGRPGELPLLEFSLTLLWEDQENRNLSLEAYQRIGGVTKALSSYADEIIDGLSSEEQNAAQQIFMQLVQPGQGSQDTRRLATRSEIGEKQWAVVRRLADLRLVVTGTSLEGPETVEVVHETLIHEWGRLRGWIQVDREFRVWQEHTRVAMHQWKDSQKNENALLRGLPLLDAQDWMEKRADRLNNDEVFFIRSSLALKKKEESRRKRIITIISSIGIMAVIVAGVAIWLYINSERQAMLARYGQIVAQAEAIMNDLPVRTLLLETQVEKRLENKNMELPDSKTVLYEVLSYTGGLRLPISENVSRESSMTISPDGHWLVVGSSDNKVLLLDMSQPTGDPTVLRGQEGIVNSINFSPDGNWLASGSEDAVRLWEMSQPTGDPIVLRGQEGIVYSMDFSPDEQWLAVGSEDVVRLWNISLPITEPIILPGLEGHILALDFSPDGQWLAIGSDDTFVRLWNINQLSSDPIVLRGHAGKIANLKFSPDGHWLATSSNGYNPMLLVWDMSKLTPQSIVVPYRQTTLYIFTMDFTMDGNWLVIGSEFGTVQLWNLGEPITEPIILNGEGGDIKTLAISPNRRWLATGSDDALVNLWDMNRFTAEPVVLRGHETGIRSLAFTMKGNGLVSQSFDGSIRLWNISQPLVEPFTYHLNYGFFSPLLALSPDSRLLATSSDELVIRLWDMDKPMTDPIILYGLEESVDIMVMSPNGRWLAVGSRDARVRIWDISQPTTEPVVLPGQEVFIRHMAFSSDGKWFATGSIDSIVRLWNMDHPNSEPIFLRTQGQEITSIAFSPDGRFLAVGLWSGLVNLWEISKMIAAPTILDWHKEPVNTLVFSPDSRWLATRSNKSGFRIWSMSETFSKSIALNREGLHISNIAFSPDSHWIAAQSKDAVRLWMMDNPDVAPITMGGSELDIRSMVFSPDGRFLAAGSKSMVQLWSLDRPTGEPNMLRSSEGYITNLAFSWDDHWLAARSYDRTLIQLWDTNNLTAGSIDLKASKYSFMSFAFSSDDRTLITQSDDYFLQLWDLSQSAPKSIEIDRQVKFNSMMSLDSEGRWLAVESEGTAVHLWNLRQSVAEPITIQGQKGSVYTMAFSPNGHWLATGSDDTNVRLWDINQPTNKPNILSSHANQVTELAFSPDSHWLATGSEDMVRLWNTSQLDTDSTVLLGQDGPVYSMAFSPNAHWLATSSYDYTIRLWNITQPISKPFYLQGHEGTVMNLAFSPDGRFLASGSVDGTLRLFDMRRPITESRVLCTNTATYSFAFSPDGHILACPLINQTVQLWNLNRLAFAPVVLHGYENDIIDLVFSPDGYWLATSFEDGTVYLWDIRQPTIGPIVLRGQIKKITKLAFSPDGFNLFVGSENNTVQKWDLDTQSLLTKACATAGRNLTQAEWAQYFPGEPYEKTCEQWPAGE